jgi:hypothetical protein
MFRQLKSLPRFTVRVSWAMFVEETFRLACKARGPESRQPFPEASECLAGGALFPACGEVKPDATTQHS